MLKHLKDLELEENTLVVFTSDNGGLPQSPQTPLRGFKGMYYEGGVRVPMIARWPGVIKAGSTSSVPVINLDLYPTFLAAAGGKVPEGKVLDGESLLPLFRSAGPLRRKAVFWHFPGYLNGPNPVLFDGACRFIEKNRERPFFVYISHHATHMAIQAREDTMARFLKKTPGARHKNLKYAAMNAQMDDGVGRVLKHLKDLKALTEL